LLFRVENFSNGFSADYISGRRDTVV
jgi:hypothetical protein